MSIMDLNFFAGCGGPILAFKKGKSSEFDFQDTGESTGDPLSQRAAHVRLAFFQQNMNIHTKIYHKIHRGPNGPLILRVFIS